MCYLANRPSTTSVIMGEARFILAEDRGVLRISGPDARTFLQGLVSNDVTRATAERAIYAALLTAQGKFLHDFFIVERDGALCLDAEAPRLADLQRRLSLYKLRSKVAIEPAPELAVALLYGDGAAPLLGLEPEPGSARTVAAGGGAVLVYVDPRLAELGVRAILPRDAVAAIATLGFAAGTVADYESRRLAAGVPDGSRDLPVEKAILLENGFDELHAIDWQKGCYMGQELTARTKYRGLIRKRLLPVGIDGPLPPPGTPVMAGDKEAGEMRSAAGDRGLAMLRLDCLENPGELRAGDARLTPRRPAWARF
jgi:folate-binding protein YgfZ